MIFDVTKHNQSGTTLGTNNLKLPEHASNTPESVINQITWFCDAAMSKKPSLDIFIPEVLPTREPRLVPVIDI